jgi:soluble lytic murein transglycosylase
MRKVLLLATAAVILHFSGGQASADFYQYTDRDGVVHITNVPTSARYRWMMSEKRPGGPHDPAPRSFEEMIRHASYRYGVDPHLVKAIVKAESDFDSLAVSEDGARGLMQLMPETARLMGVKDVHDPGENVEGGIKYLSLLLKKFGWDIPLAVAAYNAGEAAVVKYGAVPPYSETRDYVKKVLYYHRLYRGSDAE